MVHRVSFDVYDRSDVAERALLLRDESDTCHGGEWCPRCRVALAVTQLTSYFELPYDWGDDMIRMMVVGLPDHRPWKQADADEVLRKLGAK